MRVRFGIAGRCQRSHGGDLSLILCDPGQFKVVNDDPDSLIARAERALYQAKHDGRDRVSIA